MSADERNRRIVELRQSGLTLAEVGAKFGITKERVRQIVKEAGVVAKHAVHTRTKETLARIERFRAECGGMTDHEAAKLLGVHQSTVRKYEKATGLRLAREPNRGLQLAPHTIRMIEESPALAAQGMSKTEAARELGVDCALFHVQIRKYLPDLKWRDGRYPRRGAEPRSP